MGFKGLNANTSEGNDVANQFLSPEVFYDRIYLRVQLMMEPHALVFEAGEALQGLWRLMLK